MKVSTIMTSAKWANGRLTLSSRKRAPLAMISLIICVFCWILFTKESPLMIKGFLCVSIGILLWALWDVFRTSLRMQYVPKTDFLTIKAKQSRRVFLYSGQGYGQLEIKQRRVPSSGGGVDTFNLVLQFENNEACIPALLESFSYSEVAVADKIKVWNERLNLS